MMLHFPLFVKKIKTKIQFKLVLTVDYPFNPGNQLKKSTGPVRFNC